MTPRPDRKLVSVAHKYTNKGKDTVSGKEARGVLCTQHNKEAEGVSKHGRQRR
jgi:hypothetical protein